MAYNGKTNWAENEIVNPADMNRIEQGIKDIDSAKMERTIYDANGNGVVDKAEKLNTARTITLSGAVTGSITFDGSDNVTIDTILSALSAAKITSGTMSPARIAQDASNRFVSDTEINTWHGKAPESHAINGTTYGLGTESVYGHIKLINNLRASEIWPGQALAAKQGYVLDQTKAPSTKAVVTEGTALAYTATIPGITELYEGLMVCIKPHLTTTTNMPTLNVNELGAVYIVRYVSKGTADGHLTFATGGALVSNTSILLRYTYSGGSYRWVAVEFPKPAWDDIVNKPSDIMQREASQTMTASLTADGSQSESVAQVRNAVILPSGTTDFSSVANGTLIFVKE